MQNSRLKIIIVAFAALILIQLFSLFQSEIWGIIVVAPLALAVLVLAALALFSSERPLSPLSGRVRTVSSSKSSTNPSQAQKTSGSENYASGRVQGIVKWFNPEKGFGFIAQDNGDDLFVHYTEVHLSNEEVLEKDDRVELEVGPGRKGPVAKNVSRTARAESSPEGQGNTGSESGD